MSNQQLAEKLRSRAKFLSGLDWQLMREAADALEDLSNKSNEDGEYELLVDSMTGESVMGYFTNRGIKLLPWQTKKLLSKPEE